MNASPQPAPARLTPLVILGASTGGTRVLSTMCELLPPLRAAILIVQHMPEFIGPSFVTTLNRLGRMPVALARQNDRLEPGRVLVVPGDHHGALVGNERIHLHAGPRVNYVRPSIDVTMLSVGPAPAGMLAGVILTGMGRDGAAGIQHLKRLGASTVAQDQPSCAVYGMPAEAIKTGCVDAVMPPAEIVAWLVKWYG